MFDWSLGAIKSNNTILRGGKNVPCLGHRDIFRRVKALGFDLIDLSLLCDYIHAGILFFRDRNFASLGKPWCCLYHSCAWIFIGIQVLDQLNMYTLQLMASSKVLASFRFIQAIDSEIRRAGVGYHESCNLHDGKRPLSLALVLLLLFQGLRRHHPHRQDSQAANP